MEVSHTQVSGVGGFTVVSLLPTSEGSESDWAHPIKSPEYIINNNVRRDGRIFILFHLTIYNANFYNANLQKRPADKK